MVTQPNILACLAWGQCEPDEMSTHQNFVSTLQAASSLNGTDRPIEEMNQLPSKKSHRIQLTCYRKSSPRRRRASSSGLRNGPENRLAVLEVTTKKSNGKASLQRRHMRLHDCNVTREEYFTEIIHIFPSPDAQSTYFRPFPHKPQRLR